MHIVTDMLCLAMDIYSIGVGVDAVLQQKMEADVILFQETDADGDQVLHIWTRTARCVFGCSLLSTFVGWAYFLTDYKPLLDTFQSGLDSYSPRETKHLDYLLQFTLYIRFIKRMWKRTCRRHVLWNKSSYAGPVCGLPMICGGHIKDLKLQQLLQDNTTSLTLSKTRTHVPSTDVEIVCDASTGRFVPETLRKTLFSSMLDLSHPGATASIRLVSDRFVWPRMKVDIQQWTKAYVLCQKAKMGRHTHSPFVSFLSPEERFVLVHVDMIGLLPSC